MMEILHCNLFSRTNAVMVAVAHQLLQGFEQARLVQRLHEAWLILPLSQFAFLGI